MSELPTMIDADTSGSEERQAHDRPRPGSRPQAPDGVGDETKRDRPPQDRRHVQERHEQEDGRRRVQARRTSIVVERIGRGSKGPASWCGSCTWSRSASHRSRDRRVRRLKSIRDGIRSDRRAIPRRSRPPTAAIRMSPVGCRRSRRQPPIARPRSTAAARSSPAHRSSTAGRARPVAQATSGARMSGNVGRL